jgi:hypothetical protein
VAAEFPCSFGPYVLMRLLGAGSGGAAYLARPALRAPGWPPHVVVKVLRDEVAQHADDIARFEHEARVAVCVEHENVVRVLDAGRVENNLGDQLYLAMDYVDGTMLSDVRKTLADADVYLPLPVSIAILEQALRGVGALHDARGPDGAPLEFVHRDLSPRNVMVDSRGHVRLIDLGLAKSRLQEWMTTPGTTLGSAGYMPPEQAAGDPVDQGADLYAIGAVAYELFSGQRMIAPANAQKMLHDTLTYRHRPIPPGRPEVPAALDAFVERATAHGKNERFRSAEQMRQALLACGIAPAKKSTVAEFLRGRVGPVAPVPIGEEGMDTALTEAHAEHTHIIARRPELMVPDDAPADIMFAPTRAEVSPFSDPAVASSSPVSFVQPPATQAVGVHRGRGHRRGDGRDLRPGAAARDRSADRHEHHERAPGRPRRNRGRPSRPDRREALRPRTRARRAPTHAEAQADQRSAAAAPAATTAARGAAAAAQTRARECADPREEDRGARRPVAFTTRSRRSGPGPALPRGQRDPHGPHPNRSAGRGGRRPRPRAARRRDEAAEVPRITRRRLRSCRRSARCRR